MFTRLTVESKNLLRGDDRIIGTINEMAPDAVIGFESVYELDDVKSLIEPIREKGIEYALRFEIRLDEYVHDMMIEKASKINNLGLDKQMVELANGIGLPALEKILAEIAHDLE